MTNTQFEGQFEDEEVLEVFRHHPVVLRKGLYGFLGLVLVGLLPAAIWPAEPRLLWAIPGSMLLGAVWLFYAWMAWYFSIAIITDQRFIRITQRGLFNRSVVSVSLEKIQNVNYQISGLQQTVLKFGTIMVQTIVGDLILEQMSHPERIHEALIKAMKYSDPGQQSGQDSVEAQS
jgi:hypothetical protein